MIKERSIFVVILLFLCTCGIYNLYWIYITRAEFQAESGNSSINPGLELLFCILCFPYYYYWLYKASKDIFALAQSRGIVMADNSMINLLLLFFGLGIVSILILQNDLNTIAKSNA